MNKYKLVDKLLTELVISLFYFEKTDIKIDVYSKQVTNYYWNLCTTIHHLKWVFMFYKKNPDNITPYDISIGGIS